MERNGRRSNVLYVPELKYNLLSLEAALDKGMTHQSNNRMCKIMKNGSIVAMGERKNKLFYMKFKVTLNKENAQVHANIASKDSLLTWHKRMAHQNVARVKKILKDSNVNPQDQSFICEDCTIGKMYRLRFSKSKSESKRAGELVHADLCGPMQETSVGGSRYFLLLKDDYTNWREVYFLKHKSETVGFLEDFFKKTQKHLMKGIKTLRTDNGLEFANQEIKDLTQRYGVKHQKTVPYTPEQNGVIERENRTVVELARTSLHASGSPIKLWAEAVNYTVYTLNRTGTKDNNVSSIQLWLNKKVSVSDFRIFGEEAYVHIPKEKRQKWNAKAEKGLLVGYDQNTKGYRIWFSEKNKISIHRDVVFTKKQSLNQGKSEPIEQVEIKIDNAPNERPDK